jgi:hypothetical protein
MIHSPSTEPFEGKMWFGFWSAKLPADKWLDRGVKFKRSNPTDFFSAEDHSAENLQCARFNF